MSADHTVRTGDWVEVKTGQEIAETLDADGTVDGLPFMPEMVRYCGRRFRLLRQAGKTCVEIGSGAYNTREFLKDDVFLLDGLRCLGDSHDGCQRRCMLFWKWSWLRKVDSSRGGETVDQYGLQLLKSKLKTTLAPERYFCQSTQLSKSTLPQPIRRRQILVKCYRDVRSGAVGLFEMIELILVPFARKMGHRIFGKRTLVGTLERTPVGSLALQPGELVEVRTLREMQATLDRRGRNRGLICDRELGTFCGRQYRVLGRLDRMISEATGVMRKVEGTVILDGNLCLCAWSVGGCPRSEYTYWREVWLKRVDPKQE